MGELSYGYGCTRGGSVKAAILSKIAEPCLTKDPLSWMLICLETEVLCAPHA